MNNRLSNLVTVFCLAMLAPTVWAAGDPARGEQLVGVCVACHGEDGNSPMPNFPKLAGSGQKYMAKQLRDIRDNIRVVPEMAGLLDNSSDQDLADMAAFYNTKSMQLSGAEVIEVQVNSGEKVDGLKLGEKVFRAGNLETSLASCTGCHSPRGMGNDPAGYPRLSGQHAQYIEKQLRDFRAGNRTNDSEAVMRRVAAPLSDAEIIALANYIAGLN